MHLLALSRAACRCASRTLPIPPWLLKVTRQDERHVAHEQQILFPRLHGSGTLL